MAMRGLCSRREADRYIERGWVRVNGAVVATLGTRVDPDCDVKLSLPARRRQEKLITVLLNKPVGVVSGQPEKHYAAASSLIVEPNHYRRDPVRARVPAPHRAKFAPAGRLDIDSQGLLVLTEDGRVARQLISPSGGMEKEYLVRVSGSLTDEELKKLRHGLHLDGRPLRPARVEVLHDGVLRMVLTEGRKRQIRRMCELVGLRVEGLKRVRIGRVRLGSLPRGQWRFLGPDEQF